MTKSQKKIAIILTVVLCLIIGVGMYLKPYQKERIFNFLFNETSQEQHSSE